MDKTDNFKKTINSTFAFNLLKVSLYILHYFTHMRARAFCNNNKKEKILKKII